jgi:GWxTD domain-containing protein
VLPFLSWLALACRSGSERPPLAGPGGLTEGPTRWLMLPDEKRRAEHLHTSREAIDFVETFWRRRDPDPAQPGNEFAKTFYQRVKAADDLYGEGGLRGSLTDRGRALILLGPPPILRYSQKRAPAMEAGKPGARPVIHSRNLELEIWAYPVKDLPPELVRLLGDPRDEVDLTFLVSDRKTELIEGEKVLEAAARAAVRE